LEARDGVPRRRALDAVNGERAIAKHVQAVLHMARDGVGLRRPRRRQTTVGAVGG
jgi:hypothetical protein